MVRTIAVFSFILLATLTFGQQRIASAIKNGDAKALSGLFTKEVDLTFDDRGDVVSSADAEKMLESFFKANKVISYTLSHSGKAPDHSSSFTIGNIRTESRNFRIFIKCSPLAGADSIREIRINSL